MQSRITTNGQPILVLGGTGKTGRRVAAQLTARGLPVRIGSRGGTPPFDWTDRATWGPALDQTRAVYLTYYPDFAVSGAVETVRAFVDLAVDRGIRRLVLLSGRGEPEAQAAEQIVQRAPIEWTILRSSWFAQNFSEHFLREPLLGGELALPVGDVGEPFVDVDDLADIAVEALTEEEHAGRLYEVTGPRLLTFAEALAEIGAATGRELRYVQISPAEFLASLAEAGVPAEDCQLLDYLFTTVLDGRNACLTDGVQQALGRPPRDFADYARAAAAAGAWND